MFLYRIALIRKILRKNLEGVLVTIYIEPYLLTRPPGVESTKSRRNKKK